MPLVKSDIPYMLLPGVRAIFGEAYDKAPVPIYEQIATVIESGSDTEQYGWVGSVPKVREFVDERQIKALAPMDFSIKNKTWESTIGIDRAAIEDDKTGSLRLKTVALAREARRHPDELVATILQTAYTAQTCFDGQNLVSASHSTGNSGTQSNYTSSALSGTTLQAGIIAMMNFVDSEAKPLGINPDTLVVGPKLMFTARELLESTIIVSKVGDGTAGSGATAPAPYKNTLEGMLKLLISPYLTGTYDDYWFVIDSTSPVRPIIFQNRIPVEVTAMENQSESGFMRDTYAYGVRARYNAGPGFWPAIYGGIVS